MFVEPPEPKYCFFFRSKPHLPKASLTLNWFQKLRENLFPPKPVRPCKIKGNATPQKACPLFSRIPPEIRNYIFELALTAYDDKSKPYSRHNPYYRPGYHYPHIINTEILRTCRHIYLEARSLPAAINEVPFWQYRGPLDTPNCCLFTPGRIKRLQKSSVQNVHIFAPQHWLEGFGHTDTAWEGFTHGWAGDCAPNIKITIRHTDWWYFQTGKRLCLDPEMSGMPTIDDRIKFSDASRWGTKFCNFHGLKKFQFELETVDHRKHELDAIVAEAASWRFVLGDGNVLIMDVSKTAQYSWVGSKFYNGHPSRGFAVIRSEPGFCHEPRDVETELAVEDSVSYYVVTLTWYARPAAYCA